MTSQHAQPQRSFRPEPDEYAAAKAQLTGRGRHVGAYLRACLRWLDSDPDTALDTLAPHWPTPRTPGRPPRGPHDTEHPG